MTFAIGVLVIALAWLSVRSMAVTRRRAPWTFWAWAATLAYCVYVYIKMTPIFAARIPEHGEYVFLLALTILFVVAGIKDEPQAEPWYLPSRLSKTRAEKVRR